MAFVAPPTAQVVSRADSRLDRVGWTALEYAPFRYFIVSMLCGTSGIFVFNAALGWYVLGVTGSAAAVGGIFSVSGLPILPLMPGGGLTDRFGSRDAHRELRRTRRRGRHRGLVASAASRHSPSS
jgi:hypothetical protein